ncbi:MULTISPECIES: alpha/beta fold hydrolase [Streptomyces]|uniref:Alpha/beta hydrolase n=1 Tax=Streptomyces siderophoricus TaxID=2802281 RepID=A0ABS1MLH7_9ACTN|nr:hypothetical protein [Streptomyces sp. 9-7]MBL1088050.1 hypothetical protein [Streptomyces sp. 9-7]
MVLVTHSMGELVARRAAESLGPRLRGLAVIAERQRRWVETLPDGRFEEVDSGHFIQAEQPGIVADEVGHLLDRAPDRPTR